MRILKLKIAIYGPNRCQNLCFFGTAVRYLLIISQLKIQQFIEFIPQQCKSSKYWSNLVVDHNNNTRSPDFVGIPHQEVLSEANYIESKQGISLCIKSYRELKLMMRDAWNRCSVISSYTGPVVPAINRASLADKWFGGTQDERSKSMRAYRTDNLNEWLRGWRRS